MKYDKHHRDIIIQKINEGQGRVNACKAAGVHYSTFLDWLTKPEFSELVKKAEESGYGTIKDLAELAIRAKFNNQWQAAAWWLERKYPLEYRNRQEIESTETKTPDLSGLTYEQLYELRYGRKPEKDDG